MSWVADVGESILGLFCFKAQNEDISYKLCGVHSNAIQKYRNTENFTAFNRNTTVIYGSTIGLNIFETKCWTFIVILLLLLL